MRQTQRELRSLIHLWSIRYEAMVVQIEEFVFVIVGSVVLSLLILAALFAWARNVRRLVLIGVACAVGIIVWNVALNVTNATALNVDSAILGLSVQDVGSAVVACVVTLAALAVGDRGLSMGNKLGTSAIVGLVTIIVDRFG
jgi:hypothetical protein